MLHARPPWCTLHPLRTLEKPPFLKRRNQSIGEFNFRCKMLDLRFQILDWLYAISYLRILLLFNLRFHVIFLP